MTPSYMLPVSHDTCHELSHVMINVRYPYLHSHCGAACMGTSPHTDITLATYWQYSHHEMGNILLERLFIRVESTFSQAWEEQKVCF